MRNLGLNITIPTFIISNKELKSESKVLYGVLNSTCNIEGFIKSKYDEISLFIGYDKCLIDICLLELQSQNLISFSNLNSELFIEVLSNITFQKPKRSKSIKLQEKTLFITISNDFESYLTNYKKNKKYLYIAYIFWKLWFENNNNSLTLKKAFIEEWADSVRLIIENDGHDIDRLIGIYMYFKWAAKEEFGFDNFWFKEISTINAFRKSTDSGEFRIDKIIKKVNDQLNKNTEFKKDFIEMSQKVKTSNKLK